VTILPISNHVYHHLFAPAIERIGYTPISPRTTGADVIQAEIIRRLETADLVLCDISTLNPNVFFELGIRIAIDKPICLVRDGLTDQIPFDTSIINVHRYDHSLAIWQLEGDIDRLTSHLLAVVNRSGEGNTLWGYFGLSTRASLGGEKPPSLDAKLDIILSRLEALEGNRASDQVASSGLDGRVQDAIREAQVIASEVNARFNVVEIAADRIVLDPGTFNLDSNRRLRVSQMGQRLGLDLVVASPGSARPQRPAPHSPR